MKRTYFTLIIVLMSAFAFSQNNRGIEQFTPIVTAENHYTSGTTMDLNFLLDYQSVDFEYGDFISLTFPDGITPIGSPTNPFALTVEGQEPEYLNGVSGQTISWGDNSNYWGGIEIGEHPFIVNVTIDASVTGDQVVDIMVSGDGNGNPQGDVFTTCTIQEMPTTAELGVVAGPIEYTNYPLAQVSGFQVSAEVSNSGTELNTATDLAVTCELASYAETAAITLPMPTGGSESFTLPYVNPYAEGNHEIIFEVSAPGDPYTYNNTDTITFGVDSVYAHDDGGALYYYGSQYVMFSMGAAFDILTEDDLTGVQFYLGEDATIGDEFSLSVAPVTLSGEVATYGESVWESGNLNVTASMLDAWTTVEVEEADMLEVGKYALLIHEHTSNSINLGFDGNPIGDILLSVNGQNNYWEDEDYGWAMVRLVLGNDNVPQIANDAGVSAIVSPNSDASLSNAETVTLTLTNFGTEAQSDIAWDVLWDGPSAGSLSGTFAGPIAAGESVNFDAGTADLSIEGVYSFTACTYLDGDEDATNDCAEKTVIHTTPPTAGDGTESSPYEIATLENLYWLSLTPTEWAVGKYFIQTADIDASATSTWDGGKGFMPIGDDVNYFLGQYDGQGYTISNLTINRPDEEYVGLFGYGYAAGTTGGTIENVGMINPNIIGKGFVGTLIGKTAWTFTVNNCYAVNVNVTGSEDYVAGLVGSNHSAFIDYSWSSGTVSGRDRVGGLTGFHRSKTITNNYSTAVVNGSDNVGGLIGRIDAGGHIKNSYSVGQVNGTSNVGGLIGSTAASVTSSYYDTETSGMTDTGKGEPKTTAEMMQEATFVDWDFVDIWSIIENTTYPTFKSTFANDVGVSAIVSPNSGSYLSNAETVTITITNFGTEAQSDIMWDVIWGGPSEGSESGTVAGPVAAGESVTFDLDGTADLSAEGEYVFTATTYLEGDEGPSNDQKTKTVINEYSGYCPAAGGCDEFISNVLFGDIDNTSECEGYGDYTALSTTVAQGETYSLQITMTQFYSADDYGVWIDWNQNEDFTDDGENVVCEFAVGADVNTFDITVPADAPLGDTRMRIRVKYDGDDCGDPCGTTEYGEVEDYTITVGEVPPPPAGIVFEDDFEAYTAGEMVACQNPEEWTTWTNDPCGADDAYVSSDQAYSGANAVNIVTNNDLVMELDEYLTSGKHTVSLMVYVPTGGDGYYNVLSSFAPTQEWGFEVYFNAGGDASVNAGGEGAATFNYPLDTWMESKVVIDLNADWAEYYLDGDLIVEWQWTLGAAAAGCELSIGALDFFGATATTTYYFDDLKIETEEGLPQPTNLTATVVDGNDVEMNWVAPGGVGYIQWDAGTNTGNGIGLTNGGVFSVASRWTPADLAPYDGNYMTSITLFHNGDPTATFVLKAWTGANAATEILSQPVAATNIDSFNEIILDNPILIDASQELWFGYEVTHAAGTFPAGCDDGPAVQEFGDLISTDGGSSWTGMSAAYGLDYNWNIAGYLSASDNGKDIAVPMVKQSIAAANGTPVASGSNGTMATMATMANNGTRGLIGFNVYRDGELIAEEVAVTNYIDYDLLPGTYSYDVKAVYDEGISAGAGPVPATILGGIDRDLVIIEVGTGTWCQYCPGAAMGVDQMHEEGLSVGIIEYHSGDAYETTESAARIAFNNISGFPTAVFDGGNAVVGGSATESMYSSYLPKYESRIDIPSLFDIEAHYSSTGAEDYQVSVDVEMVEEYPSLSNELVLQVVLTESHIPENWQNQSELNFVCRDMIPDANGTTLDFSGNTTQSVQLDFTIPSEYVAENLELIAFVQDMTTLEILQATTSELITGVETVAEREAINIFPNPATDLVNISSNVDIQTITVLNSVGQVVLVKKTTNNQIQLNTSHLNKGLYFIQLETENGISSKRVVIE